MPAMMLSFFFGDWAGGKIGERLDPDGRVVAGAEELEL